MRVLMIHGRAQQFKNRTLLKKTWVEALQKGLVAGGFDKSELDLDQIDFPYYGDQLFHLTNKCNSRVQAKGNEAGSEYEVFVRDVLKDLSNHGAFDVDQMHQLRRSTGVREKGAENWEWVHKFAAFIDNSRPEFGSWLIEKFLADVFIYLRNSEVKKSIDAIVETTLTNEPTVVVGHSLGSIVGYNVIRANKDRAFVGFVTIGSPLGINSIKTIVGDSDNPVGQNWHNAYDERDIVALNPLAPPYFQVSPPIQNDGQVRNHTSNRHGIKGYLDQQSVANSIAKLMRINLQ